MHVSAQLYPPRTPYVPFFNSNHLPSRLRSTRSQCFRKSGRDLLMLQSAQNQLIVWLDRELHTIIPRGGLVLLSPAPQVCGHIFIARLIILPVRILHRLICRSRSALHMRLRSTGRTPSIDWVIVRLHLFYNNEEDALTDNAYQSYQVFYWR